MDSALIPVSEDASNPLRLTFCARCDYPLRGLPNEGACPECGTPYDEKYVILRGRPVMTGSDPNSQHAFSSRRFWWAVAWVLAAVLLMYLLPRFIHWSLLTWNGGSVLNVVLETIILSTAVRRGEILVWTSADGIGQQSPLDPESPLPKISLFIGVGFCVALLLWGLWKLRELGAGYAGLLPMGIFAVMVVAAVWYDRRKATPFAVPPRGIRPGLLPWSAYSKVEWNKLPGDRYELLASSSSRVGRPSVVHVRVDLSPAAAGAFESRLNEWTRDWTVTA
jgi:hypothetical protein